MHSDKLKFKVIAVVLVGVVLTCFIYTMHSWSSKKQTNENLNPTSKKVTQVKSISNKAELVINSSQKKKTANPKNEKKVKKTKENKKRDVKVSNVPKPKSGAIATGKLLWESDAKFLNKQKKYKCNIRMAAFKTVLPDPLPGEEENVSIGADKLAGTVLLPGEMLSQNEIAGPYTISRGYKKGPTYSGGQVTTTIGGGVCKIATTLYNVAIMSNLRIVERHHHSMVVPYVPPGQDATVFYGSKDIRFKNNKSYPILLWAKTEGNTLYMAIYGQEKPPKVTWHHEILSERETYYNYTSNPDLPKGTKKVVMEGYKGYRVNSQITLEMPDGTKKTKELGISSYAPMPGLIEVGRGE